MTRLENHIEKREVGRRRGAFVERFIAHYPRRVVLQAEWRPKGANPRCVLTNLEVPPQSLYDDCYVQRGADSDHRITELKLGIAADRLSCSNFSANQWRLLLALAVYILMLTIRQAAAGTPFATAQVERLRSMLGKGAARVKGSARRILVELAASCPLAAERRQIVPRLCAPERLGCSCFLTLESSRVSVRLQ